MESDSGINIEADAEAGVRARVSRSVADEVSAVLAQLGVEREQYAKGSLFTRSPIDGSRIGKLQIADFSGTDHALQRAQDAATTWSMIPPAQRGDFVRRIGDELRRLSEPLARLVTLETGKTMEESRLEVSFSIGCCDQAFASAREIGNSISRAEREGYWINEIWRTLGVTGCVSPFNRPLSHFAGLCFMSLVCGNSVVWKPSQRAPLSALAMHTILSSVARETSGVPDGLVAVVYGGRDVGKILAEDFRLRFLDAATSIASGRILNAKLAQSLTRAAFNLGGNNATIVCRSAELKAAINAIVANAMLGGGQHTMCTRRIFVHTTVYDTVVNKLKYVFERLPVGDPRDAGTMMGPLIDSNAFEKMQRTLVIARNAGAIVTGGARIDMPRHAGGYYVRPAIAEMRTQADVMLRETLTPIVFITPFEQLSEALQMDAASESAMASAIFTHNMSEVDEFLRCTDSGMINVNTLHAGYELNIAPAGARASGGGRLPSTASWKVFMQRCFLTMNMSGKDKVPDMLAMVERGEI